MSGTTGADTRALIIDAATRLFARRGYSGVAIREIADAVGMSKPALYYHFKSKEDLCRAILGGLTDRARGLDERLLAVQGNARDRLCWLVRERFAFAREHSHYMAFAVEFFAGPDTSGLRHEFTSRMRVVEQSIRTLIHQGQDEGIYRADADPDTYVNILTGVLDRYCILPIRAGAIELTDELADTVVDALIQGLRP